LFADTMGDLDHVRGSLTRTLNQLEMVGHARRIVGGRDSSERADQSLSDVLAELARHQLADRARRRQVNLRLPTDGGVTITADSVLLQLALQRLLNAFVDLGKKTDLVVTAEQSGDRARITSASPIRLRRRPTCSSAGRPSSPATRRRVR
jgi:signal transduction histidine kinase